ncbi:MAG: hypothetical protein HRT44_01145 [Bdellovibrionales bacterium]|nr:hypothetical protein [Bdellovibrionales bacterium]NQZ17854.1 hypothetical protein [Bdellovibrionales bacterium]
MRKYLIKSFYFFKDLPEETLEDNRQLLKKWANELGIHGLVIIGKEGFNTTLSAKEHEQLPLFIDKVKEHFGIDDIFIKTSYSEKAPFRRFVAKVRDEIVTIGRPDIVPGDLNNHLSPEQWNQMMERDDVVVVDTRNDYEIEIGTFENALDLNIKEFTEFPDKMEAAGTDKEKPHLIFCTGGIRCEKAIYDMQERGFKNVYQLDGGILNYLEQKPNEKFQGECFVFDSRVSVDQELNPSEQYSLCPQCGEVGTIEINCKRCDAETKICKNCHSKLDEQPSLETCSKNCEHHYRLRPGQKGPQQRQFYHD